MQYAYSINSILHIHNSSFSTVLDLLYRYSTVNIKRYFQRVFPLNILYINQHTETKINSYHSTAGKEQNLMLMTVQWLALDITNFLFYFVWLGSGLVQNNSSFLSTSVRLEMRKLWVIGISRVRTHITST